MNAIVQHEHGPAVRVVDCYDATILGAPFQVVLIDAVKAITAKSGKVKHQIPDLPGLMKAIVRTRVQHAQKLSGAEIKFVRKALGLKSKTMAQFLDVTPEHMSRVEAEAKVLSGASEKLFRLYSYAASLCADPEAALSFDDSEADGLAMCDQAEVQPFQKLVSRFLSMEIKTFRNPDKLLRFAFIRPRRGDFTEGEVDGEIDGGKWLKEPKLIAA